MNGIYDIISDTGIVPVIKLNSPERDAVSLAKALVCGGINVAEVTFRAQGADKAIRLMKEAFPDMAVGAGTVINAEQVDCAIVAGASFIVSPGFDPELVKYCISRGVAVFPGCTTASEYQAALRLGLGTVKFFPAEQSGGLPKIKALSGPFPMLKVMPTGGITLENLGEYSACPVICACGGSYMVKESYIENGEWDRISGLCRESVAVVRAARAKR